MTSSTRELIAQYNDLAAIRKLPALFHWKASKEALRAKIDGLMIQETTDPLAIPEAFGEVPADTMTPEAAEDTTDDHGEPDEVLEPSAKPWTIGAMVKELLLDQNGYDYPFIVEAVRREFPTASTSTRSVASVAAALRRDGEVFPMRRKPARARDLQS